MPPVSLCWTFNFVFDAGDLLKKSSNSHLSKDLVKTPVQHANLASYHCNINILTHCLCSQLHGVFRYILHQG